MASDFVELALSDPEAVISALVDRRDVTIGDVFPGLRNDVSPIQSHELDTRSFNGLHRANCDTWTALATMTVGDLWNVPYMGDLSVERILSAAAARNIGAYLSDGSAFRPAADEVDAAASQTTSLGRFNASLRELAAGLGFDGRDGTFGDLVDVIAHGGSIDPALRTSVEQLRATPLDDLLDPAVVEERRNLAAAFVAALGDDRTEIFVERSLRLEDRPTLEELGGRLGITRERVRQIEVQLARKAAAQCEAARFSPLVDRARRLAQELGPIRAYDEQARAVIAENASGFTEPEIAGVRDLLLWIAGPYRLVDGWLVRKGADPDSLAREFDNRFGGTVFVDADAVTAFAADHGLPDTATLLDHLRGWRRLEDGRLARWKGAIGDKAFVALSAVGEPMLADDLNAWIGESHSTGTLKNALSADERFVRIDRENRFGLRGWGHDEYLGIWKMLRSRIEREGPVSLETVAAEFAERYRVSERSVHMYADTPAFVVEDGIIRLRRDDEPIAIDARIRDANGAYVDTAARVIVHVPVDVDVLRGSGLWFPMAAAAELGVGVGESSSFVDPNTGQSVTISWRVDSTSGSGIGSLRLVAEGLGAVDGDTLRLRFDLSDKTYLPEIADVTTLAGATGLEIQPGEERAVVAAAIRCKKGAVRKRLKARGDGPVAALIPKD